ncbi:hypothetical protein [Aliikangiella sp. G2MR2-5]|uniref:hypothetical protein n=1 Tax=Aliikangiella sp. G2MR2-5 TaxID=2788943 RepID=UPI0018A8CF2D|nr:hypothetical protein [Aliikangiella sp. G2MR2-5]
MHWSSLKSRFKNMALTPKTQLKRLLAGTLGALICMLALVLTADLEIAWLFWGLSIALGICILYSLPGYLGIWLWRMRSFFFDLD